MPLCRRTCGRRRVKLTGFGKKTPRHGSLQFQKRGRFWRVRIGSCYRALALAVDEGYLWFWIGTHDEYERILANR